MRSFSVVIASYNYARYVERALASVLAQDYPAERLQVIVVDDGSTDGSREILARHAADPRLTLLLQQNAGHAAALVHGVAHARHDYVCLLDADDTFRADKLKVLDQRIAALGGGEALFLCHDLELYDEARGAAYSHSWFEVGRLAGRDSASLAEAASAFPFSVPAGQVYSRALLAGILEGLPAGDWRSGVDNAISHAALLRTGRVHYVADRLAQYRIHGANRLVAFDARGRFVQRPEAHPLLLQRRPKLLLFLERYLDTLGLDYDARQERIAYLKRLGATLPVSSRFAVGAPPRLSFVVGDGDDAGRAATLEALARQTHAHCEVLVAERGGGERAALAAMRRASGAFVCLVECGDCPDRDFAERHLYIHHYVPAVMVSACDYRLESRGDPAQEGGYGRRKLWPARRRVLPLGRVPGGHWWAFAPRSGNVLRRTDLVELFVEHALEHGVPAGVPAEWLLLHYAAALGGCMQFSEVLTTLRYESGHPGGMHARDPGDARFVPRLRQPQAALHYLDLTSRHLERFAGHFGAQLREFARWTLQVDA